MYTVYQNNKIPNLTSKNLVSIKINKILKSITMHCVLTKSMTQIANHAQKHFLHLEYTHLPWTK